MKRIFAGVFAAALGLSFSGAAMNAAEAAPFPSLKGEHASPAFHEAQYRRDRDGRMERRDRSPRHEGRRGFERRGNDNYYNGQRGYRDYRRGYRQYNGWWFPPSAFIAGAILGGAAASPPVVVQRPAPVRLSAAHVRWCQDRWKSYRVSDNTYQPSNGPRQVCVSPY